MMSTAEVRRLVVHVEASDIALVDGVISKQHRQSSDVGARLVGGATIGHKGVRLLGQRVLGAWVSVLKKNDV